MTNHLLCVFIFVLPVYIYCFFLFSHFLFYHCVVGLIYTFRIEAFNWYMYCSHNVSSKKKQNLKLCLLQDHDGTSFSPSGSLFPLTYSLRSISLVAQSYLTLCNPMDCSTPGFLSITYSRSLFKLISIKSVMPSNHLIQSISINVCVWYKMWSFYFYADIKFFYTIYLKDPIILIKSF